MSDLPDQHRFDADPIATRLTAWQRSALGRWLPWLKQAGRALPQAPAALEDRPTPVPESVTPLFVGGSWRSGTTVLHALICTSPRVNDYIGECSYFSALLYSLTLGLSAFGHHTRYYFDSPEELIASHAAILRAELRRTWQRLGTPPILALKDPLLTPSFPLLARALPEARFVVSLREPRDTLASRIDVSRRMSGADPTIAEVRQLCLEFAAAYRAIADNVEVFGNRLCLIEYRAVVEGDYRRLRDFGLTDLNPGTVWQSRLTDVHYHDGNPWLTPLYGTGLSAASVGSYRDRLPSDLEALVLETCGEVWERLATLAQREIAA